MLNIHTKHTKYNVATTISIRTNCMIVSFQVPFYTIFTHMSIYFKSFSLLFFVLLIRSFVCDQMMSYAWSNYEKYAWGANELDPIAKSANYHTVFGIAPTGSTIVDAMDTLYIMGMRKEFEKASEWVKKQLDFDKVSIWDGKNGNGTEII